MKESKQNNAVINYRKSGKGETILLFVHGSYIDQTYWKAQADYFQSDFTVITLDLPGHGLSGNERRNWSTEGFAADVVAVINELNLKNVILIGHSWGADVNLFAATQHPEPIKGFIAVDYYKSAGTPAAPQEQIDEVKANLKKDFAATNENYARLVLLTPETSAEITNRIVSDYRNAYEPMGQVIMPEVFEMYKTQRALLPKLKHKLYLINVDYMPTNEQPLKQYCPNGYEVIHMPGTCHFPMLENPQTLNKHLARIVDEISLTT